MNSLGPVIDELLAPFTAGIEPCLQRLGLSGRPLPKGHNRFVGCLQTIVGDREDDGVHVGFVLVRDLDDVFVRSCIEDLENIGSRGQYLGAGAPNFNRRTEGDCGLPVGIVGL